MDVENRFVTPAKAVVPPVIDDTANTPGGFRLFDFLNGLQASPFKRSTASSATLLHTPRSRATPRKHNAAQSPTTTPRSHIEWHECQIDSQRQFLHLIDWSIKSHVELQCQPANAMAIPSDARIQQQAMRWFVSRDVFCHTSPVENRCSSTTRPINTAHVEWTAGLYFWQHPAIHPLPRRSDAVKTSTLQGSQMPHLRVHQERRGDKDTSATGAPFGRLLDSIPSPKRKRPRALHDVMKDEVKEQHHPDDFWTIRHKEWQEAFRSLYLNWMETIHRLDQLDECDESEHVKMVSDSYFHVLGEDQTILFRVGLDSNDDTEAKARPRMVPEIVMSTSNLMQRKRLDVMGIQYKALDRLSTTAPGLDLTDESTPVLSPASGQTNADDASPNIKAELVALRRAQTVGADVTVAMRPKVNLTNHREQAFPIVMSGIDDCASFFELYMNSWGALGMTDRRSLEKLRERDRDVPLLLCRKLGPFVHATVKQVQVATTSTNEESVTIDITGHILPCALRDVVCASVRLMQENAGENHEVQSDTDDDDEEVGSHHLLVRAVELNRWTTKNKPSSTIEGLNSQWSVLNEHGHAETQHCHTGETLALAVWDITRPAAVAFKLDAKYVGR